MKIAIPVDESSTDSPVCISYGRAPFFLLYDTTEETAEYLDNSAVSAMSGAGILATQSLIDAGAEVVLTIRCGENAAKLLNTAGISLYKTVHKTAAENITAYLKDALSPLTEIHAGFHHGE